MQSLYQICVSRVVDLLKTEWDIEIPRDGFENPNKNFVENNPFSVFPVHIIQDLVNEATKYVGDCKGLFLLVTSGRVDKLSVTLSYDEDFTLEFSFVLQALTFHCQNLRYLRLMRFEWNYIWGFDDRNMARAIEVLVWSSPNLEYLETNCKLDVCYLKSCTKLSTLKIFFKQNLTDFLQKQNYSYQHRNNLLYLDPHELRKRPFAVDSVANILTFCPNLIEIDVDIAPALIYLHGQEHLCGNISAQYKLEKCILGNGALAFASASADVIQILGQTCPSIRTIDIYTDSHEAICALKHLPSLRSLRLEVNFVDNLDFILSVVHMIEVIGQNLTSLYFSAFEFIDIAAVATCCPNLEYLKFEVYNEIHLYDCPPICFERLNILDVRSLDEGCACSGRSLLMFLSHSKSLQILYMDSACNLTDDILKQVLQSNSLSSLHAACLHDCNLGPEGLRALIASARSLQTLYFTSLTMQEMEIIEIVQSANEHREIPLIFSSA